MKKDMSRYIAILVLLFAVGCQQKDRSRAAVVIQTDFGVKDGAVAAMKGVAYGVSGDIDVFDLTHEIPAYNIWEAAYRLNQVIPFWPANTVFVSVVDPGVGTERKSVVIKTKQGHYIVTPDNGTITLVAESEGIEAVRQIDENLNRRQGSDSSYTFHGRDVYMYTAAKLAAGVISFEKVGPLMQHTPQMIAYQQPVKDSSILKGNIPVLDPQYGNVWTNIPDGMIKSAGIKSGDSLDVRIAFKDSTVYAGKLPFANTFGDVAEGKPLAYINSLMNFSVAINRGNFAQSFKVSSGPDWTIRIKK